MKVFDRTLDILERALDARGLRHEVLASNLANANTPGFVPRDVDFPAAMARASEGSLDARPEAPMGDILLASAGSPLSVPGTAGQVVVQSPGAAAGLDGNAVDVDRALVALAENAIQYGAAARAAGKKLAILRYVASDGVG
jgi:flagellar basal-body rod protein FlgB